jgi:hypothetical protein
VTWKGRATAPLPVRAATANMHRPTDELDVVVVADPGLGVWHAAEGTCWIRTKTSARHYGSRETMNSNKQETGP